MVRVNALQNAVDLVLVVVARWQERSRDEFEDGAPPIRGGGDRLEPPIPKEGGELGRPVEGRAPDLVPFRPLHPCDDTQTVPPVTPDRITIVEVAPRDGLQAEERTLATETKLELLDRLADAGHTIIEATSFVSPKAVPQLADAEELMRLLTPRAGIRYTALVPNEIGLERALACGVKEIAVFASASESYSRKNLNRSREEAIAAYAPVVRRAKDARLRVRGYLSMAFADPWDGPTPAATVIESSRKLLDQGCDELSLGDTVGTGTPGDVSRLIDELRRGRIALERVAFHFHDTYGQALANALAAMNEGVTTFDASTGGIGGSPFAKMAGGNLATEDLAFMCAGTGIHTGLDLDKLVATSHWLAEQLGRELPAHVSRVRASGKRDH